MKKLKFVFSEDINKPKQEVQDIIRSYFYRQTRSIEEILIWSTQNNCSDVYIKVGEAPYISRYGNVMKLPCTDISKDSWARFYDKYVLNEHNAKYVRQKLLDISVELRIPESDPNYGNLPRNFYRYRASFGYSEEKNIVTFRMIRPVQPTFETLNYPVQCKEALHKAMRGGKGISIFTGATGSGKSLVEDTPIPTPQGYKTIKEVKIGDTVFTPNGEETIVLDKYQPYETKFYEITFSNGVKVKAGGGHLWKLSNDVVVDTNYLYNHHKGLYLDRVTEPIELPTAPINKCVNYTWGGFYGLYMDEFTIPKMFIGSISQRLQLLAGILDHYSLVHEVNGFIVLHSNSKSNLQNIKELCTSLGLYTYPVHKRKKFPNYYTLYFIPGKELIDCLVLKKVYLSNTLKHLPRLSSQWWFKHIGIKEVKEIPKENKEYYCLSVKDLSHMFLCSYEFVPTHNSSTMAACINTFTQKDDILDNKVIITLEDPIENTFESTASVKVVQKELDRDFKTFPLGIKGSLREHPQLICIGEARDKEVICAAIEASRTGHLVVTSFHSSDVEGTVSRILYHLDNDKNLAYDLIMNLNIIMSQRLIKGDDGYIVDTQYLLFDDYVVKILLDSIIEGKDIVSSVRELMRDSVLLKEGKIKHWDYQ